MTREESIDIIKCLAWHTRPKEEDVEQAIKALEQESVLDKIRVEIDKIYEREGSSFDCLNALDELKEFIDKLKTESEE